MLKIRLVCPKTFGLSFVVFWGVGFVNRVNVVGSIFVFYLYCRRVFYFGPHNISWLYEVGLHIYHCRMEVVLSALVIGFCNPCQWHPTFTVLVWCTALFVIKVNFT